MFLNHTSKEDIEDAIPEIEKRNKINFHVNKIPQANKLKQKTNYVISLSGHEQVCLSGLCFERYFSHHRAT